MKDQYKHYLLTKTIAGCDESKAQLIRAGITEKEITDFQDALLNSVEIFKPSNRVSKKITAILNEFNQLTDGEHIEILESIYDYIETKDLIIPFNR